MTLGVANLSTPPIFWAVAGPALNESASAAAVNSENFLDMVCLLVLGAHIAEWTGGCRSTGLAIPKRYGWNSSECKVRMGTAAGYRCI